jgi:hypothetical protein
LKLIYTILTIIAIALAKMAAAQKPNVDSVVISIKDSANADIAAASDSLYDEEVDDDAYNEADSLLNIPVIPTIKNINTDSVATLKNSNDFAYMAILDSLLRANKNRDDLETSQNESSNTGKSIFDNKVVKYLFWLLAIGIVSFVIYNYFKGSGGAFGSNKTSNANRYEVGELQPTIDNETALEQAIRNGNYTLAVRLLFINTLDKLGQKGAIELSTEKTNLQYATELKNKPYADAFAKLCLQYEFIWFGKFDVNKTQFENIQNQYQQFLKTI